MAVAAWSSPVPFERRHESAGRHRRLGDLRPVRLVENVLLYNVGSGLFGPLVTGGVTCRRQRSRDGWHHVRYVVIESAPDPGGGAVSARADVEVGGRLPRTAGGFWEALRPGLYRVGARLPADASFTVDLTVTGQAAAARLAATIKPLLDGWVSATHCHDGTGRDILMPRLGNADQAAAQWAQLCDPAAAVLDTRPLLRPFRDGIAWNPADERCEAFRIVPRPGPSWPVLGHRRGSPPSDHHVADPIDRRTMIGCARSRFPRS